MLTLTLPSNSSPERFPENTVSTFKVQLADHVNLQGAGEYEIGLGEIQHPTVIKNITKCWISVDLPHIHTPKAYMKEGLYTDEETFFKELENTIASRGRDISLITEKAARKTTFVLKPQSTLHISKNLADILGFDRKNFTNSTSDSKSFTADQAYDLFRGLDHIYVYCNLCSNVVLGHTSVPLLRCINSNIMNAPRPQCTTFNKVAYVPMGVRNFDNVTVYLRTSSGLPVPFMSGTCVVQLVIRRKSKIH